MSEFGFLTSSLLVRKANRMKPAEIQAVQQERLKALLAHARAHSPYFRGLYQNLGPDPDLTDLPITTKGELMGVFDQWLTDPSITLAKVQAYLANEDNIGRLLEHKCKAYYTSGSTGIQCIVLYDENSMNVMAALNYFRSFANCPDFAKAILKGARYSAIFAPGFYVEHGELRSQVLSSPFNKLRTQFVDVADSTEDIVRQLNRFKPNLIGTYPSAVELLLPEIRSGRLKINPNIVVIGGENSTPELRTELREALHCSVFNTYGATEGGMVAFECSEGHSHINSDWVIIEPVDDQYRPVPPGVRSHKILLTNLANYLQPYIRYEVTDRVIMADTPCKCGSSLPYLTIEGRTDDVLEFESRHGPVKIIPFNLMPDSDMPGLLRYQLVQIDPYTLEMRLQCSDEGTRTVAFARTKRMILKHLAINHVDNVTVYLSEIPPQLTTKSGKFKSVIKAQKNTAVINDDND